MKKRKQLSKRARFDVFKRDAFACQYCGRTPPAIVLECDHIIAVADGGSDDQENLITACFDCNRGKAAVPLHVLPEARIRDLERRMELAEQTAQYNAFLVERRAAEDFTIDELGQFWNDSIRPDSEAGKFTFGPPRVVSVRTFLRHITETEVYDAMELALARFSCGPDTDDQAWRYFCGICWRKIKGNAKDGD